MVVRASEDLDGWVTLDAIIFAQVGLFCTVDLDEGDIFLFEGGGSLFIFGGQGFAVSTPGGEELCENEVVTFNEIDKCVFLEIVNIGR